MLLYLIQSVIIGIFNFIRILSLKKFSTEGFRIGNMPAFPTKGTKYFTAFFFAIFIFTVIFKLFGSSMEGLPFNGFYLSILAAAFFLSHLFSFIYNWKKDTKDINIGHLMFFPYARIIPMHLTIIASGVLGVIAIVWFLVLKTVADVTMHSVEHKVLKLR